MRTFIVIKGEIYRKYSQHWLKVSPWDAGEDRRLAFSEVNKLLETKKAKEIDKNYAYRILNKQFKDYSTDWFHEGNLFKIMKGYDMENSPSHSFEIDGCNLSFKICWSSGSLYWKESSDDDRVRLYKFEGLDKQPGSFVKFVGKDKLKTVYQLKYNKKTHREYWEAI